MRVAARDSRVDARNFRGRWPSLGFLHEIFPASFLAGRKLRRRLCFSPLEQNPDPQKPPRQAQAMQRTQRTHRIMSCRVRRCRLSSRPSSPTGSHTISDEERASAVAAAVVDGGAPSVDDASGWTRPETRCQGTARDQAISRVGWPASVQQCLLAERPTPVAGHDLVRGYVDDHSGHSVHR